MGTDVLQLFRAITETAGLSDLAALARSSVAADTAGLSDVVDVQLVASGGTLETRTLEA